MKHRYYIVRSFHRNKPFWSAYPDTFITRLFGINKNFGYIRETISFNSADDCEKLLENYLNNKSVDMEVVRVVEK